MCCKTAFKKNIVAFILYGTFGMKNKPSFYLHGNKIHVYRCQAKESSGCRRRQFRGSDCAARGYKSAPSAGRVVDAARRRTVRTGGNGHRQVRLYIPALGWYVIANWDLCVLCYELNLKRYTEHSF